METEITTKILQKIREDIAALTESMNARFATVDAQLVALREELSSFRVTVNEDVGVLSRAILRLMDRRP